MKHPDAPLSGFVLSGGQSRRMGADKGLLAFRGRPLALIAAETLREICQDVTILANPEKYAALGYPVKADDIPGLGPLGGLLTALRHSGTNEICLLACDLPFVSAELFQFLRLQMSPTDEACIPVEDNRMHPLCGIYRKSMLPAVERQVKENRLGILRFLRGCQTRYVRINGNFEGYTGELFRNMNSPEDLIKNE